MRRNGLWVLLVGGVLTMGGVLWQAFTISAYVRGAGDGALDAHGIGSMVVHLGELAIVIGAIWAWWPNKKAVGLALAFLVLSVVQLAVLGDTEKEGGWINGLHGFLAVFIFGVGAMVAHRAARALGLGSRTA